MFGMLASGGYWPEREALAFGARCCADWLGVRCVLRVQRHHVDDLCVWLVAASRKRSKYQQRVSYINDQSFSGSEELEGEQCGRPAMSRAYQSHISRLSIPYLEDEVRRKHDCISIGQAYRPKW